MFRNNENTLPFFQVNKKKSFYKPRNVEHIENEIKQYGFAYCYNQDVMNELQMKGYIVEDDIVRKNDSL